MVSFVLLLTRIVISSLLQILLSATRCQSVPLICHALIIPTIQQLFEWTGVPFEVFEAYFEGTEFDSICKISACKVLLGKINLLFIAFCSIAYCINNV